MALLFFSGTLIYVTVLLTNAVAILSEERFLARSEQQHLGVYVSDVNPEQLDGPQHTYLPVMTKMPMRTRLEKA